MDSKHLLQAERHLARAREAVEQICAAKTLPDMENAWSDFIMAVGTVYNKLEGGSRGHPESWKWWLTTKADRKNDSVLNYVFQARNADEHGVVEVGAREKIGITTHAGGARGVGGTLADIIAAAERPGSPLIVTRTARFKLVPVTNSKFGDTFYPPLGHAAPAISDTLSPAVAATHAIVKVETVVSQARALAPAP